MTTKVKKPTVCLVDDDAGVRNTIRLVMKEANIPLVSFTNSQDFLANFHADDVACILLDLCMPGMSGLELQETLRERGLTIPIILLTGHADVPVAVQAVKAGAFDVIEKPFQEDHLLERIQAAFAIHEQWQKHADAKGAIVERIGRLTRREREVLDLMVAGKKNKDIAVELGISPKTLDIHRSKVMEKMEARTVADLVRWRLFEQSSGKIGEAGWLC
ncbi:MAG: response regulator [Gemmataceae bacterium]